MEREVAVGQVVVFHDSRNRPHQALVTCVWNPGELVSTGVNVVFVSLDEERSDSYGRQIERETSVVHGSCQPAHGHYWRFEDEVPNKVIEPVK